MRKEPLVAVAAGVLGGLLLVAAWRSSFLGLVLGTMFSPLPLAMAALGLGLVYLPLAIAGGAVTVAVMTGSFALSTLYLVIDAAPVAILTRIALVAERQAQANPDSPAPVGGAVLGFAMVGLALAAVLVMAAGLAAFPAGPDGLEASLRDRLVELMTQIQSAQNTAPIEVPQGDPLGTGIATDAMAKAMARVLPGAAALNWAFRALVSTVLAQRFLARDGFARWPTPAYRTLAVPGWYIGVFWVAAIAAWWTPGDAGFIAANAVVVMSLPLMLQGLAVVHTAIAWFGFGRIALIAFYCVALVAAGAAIALIVMLGVAEHFFQIRARRFGRPRDGGT